MRANVLGLFPNAAPEEAKEQKFGMRIAPRNGTARNSRKSAEKAVLSLQESLAELEDLFGVQMMRWLHRLAG